MDTQLLKTIAHKLGISSPKVLRKAEELIRLLAVQGGSGLTLTMSGKAVICLEIAATQFACSFDKTLAVRLSGLTRPQYVASSQTVSRLLNISPSVCIADLCVTHSATAAKDLACQVIKQYETENNIKGQVDTELPVYQTAAVVAVCKILKIKIDKRRMFEASRSKRVVYDKVVEGMTKIAESLNTQKKSKSGTKRSKTLMDMVEENLRNESPEKKLKEDSEDKEHCEDGQTDFEEWKRKILEAAAAAQ